MESTLALLLSVGIGCLFGGVSCLFGDMISDQFQKRPYKWLIDHYLSAPDLLAKADASKLAVIEMNGGCSKAVFRRRIMRHLLDNDK